MAPSPPGIGAAACFKGEVTPSKRAIGKDGVYTLLSTMRCTFRRRSTSWRGSSSAAAICSAPSPCRCMRKAWERLLRLSPGLGSPGGWATGGCFCRSWRSEERRGGKEGRSRGAPHYLKKKNQQSTGCEGWARHSVRRGGARQRRVAG